MDIDDLDKVNRDEPDSSILIKGKADRPHSKSLYEFDPNYNDYKYKLKGDFYSCMHPDNLEEALVSYLKL